MIVLVTGGRDYRDRGQVVATLDRIHAATPITRLVHGAARGADTFAAGWAFERFVIAVAYPALWHTHGRAAGVLRNQTMLDREPIDLVVAFPGGRGTADMVNRARRAGVAVQVIG